jgi:regulator of sigma E protease
LDHNEGIKSGTPNPASSEQYRDGASPLPPAAPVPDIDTDENPGFFTPTNIVILGMMVTLAGYLVYKFELLEMWNIFKAVLGLSFVIFIHELGHFLAAKWCNVNVTTFSIGFGPPIPGCWFTWGETTYKLAVIPLGGYVQMVGQVDGDEASDGSEDDPRSYRRKTVGQRMLIISAGVIMNAILALVCFIVVYMGPGKEHPAAVIHYVDANAPAYTEGLRSGSMITEFDGYENPTFTQLMQSVINSLEHQKLSMKYKLKDQAEKEVQIEALIPEETRDRAARPMIGVASPPRLQLANKRSAREAPYLAGTPAAEAKFVYGDVIIAMTDPDPESQKTNYRADLVKDLPDDWRNPEKGQRDYFEFVRRLQLLMDKEIIVRVKRGHEDKTESVDLKVAPIYRIDLGVRMKMGEVLAIRKGSPADTRVRPPVTSPKKLEGDRIEAVIVKDDDGKDLEFKGETLDPERLPFQLREWSDRLDRAGKPREKRMVTLHLKRHSEQAGDQFITHKVDLEWDTDWRFDRAAPLSPNAPMPIPELGLAYQIRTMVEGVGKGGSVLKVGDVIKNVRYDFESLKDDIKVPWPSEDLKDGQWANVSFEIFQQPFKCKKLVFKVLRDNKIEEIDIPIKHDSTWPLMERGWRLSKDTRRVKASDPFHAIQMGFSDTGSRMMEVFQNVRGMIMGRISFKNLGGPLTIAQATYIFAGMDFGEFMFFLGLISINLAVVNFLPIPVLDGGHMVFLIYEKIRGQPANENVRIAATYAGLAMILLLMGFVLYLDVTRIFL